MQATAQPLRILVVHSSAELYGSDRSLLDIVRHRGEGMRVTVALPEHGALVAALEEAGATVIVGEVCKINRDMGSFRGFLQALMSARRALRFLGAAHRATPFDLVYSNTVAVLGGAVCAKRWSVPHVWHVREIVAGSDVVTAAFRRVVAMLSNLVVCNSGPTLEWIRLADAAAKYRVVWNGFDLPAVVADRQAGRARLGVDEQDLLFVLVGRINGWKGQKLLVDAFARMLQGTDIRARLAIVGSAPAGQERFERELATHVERSGCADRICVMPFVADIESVWMAADVAVVPSTEPEPFGRVAIEAMAFGRPVIAAAHGGLLEIVRDGETGRLVTPRCAEALATAMTELARDGALRARMGVAGQARQRAAFSVDAYARQLSEVLCASAVGRS